MNTDQTDMLSGNGGHRRRARLWAYDEWADDDMGTGEGFAGDLTSLGFIRAALRRRARLWCAIAVVGMLAGLAVFVKFPADYQASASLLLTAGPNSNAQTAILNDQSIAQSRAVAGDALQKLGPQQSAASFVNDYTVTPLTDRVLLITAKAKSSDLAVREANALADAFLAFQARLLEIQERLTNAELQQQIVMAQQQVSAINDQISRVLAQPASRSRQASLTGLRAERSQSASALSGLEQAVASYKVSIQVATTAAVQGSQVLDTAAPITQHRKKLLVEYVGGGLLAGLVLGLGIVIVSALLSDRLRRRDDVARALGVPVRLSVGKVRLSRRGLAGAQSREARQIVAYMSTTIHRSSHGPASLAVIPVDDVRVSAVCLASLAVSCAQEGWRVVVADLCRGAPAARLLGVSDPGVHTVSTESTNLAVTIPDPDDVVPTGPLHRASGAAAEPLAAACASADILLTIAALDPSLGGEHLAGWASTAVVTVTAGQSSEARIHAVGEMIRIAGTPVVSAVLVGADKTDESLGITHAVRADSDIIDNSDAGMLPRPTRSAPA